MKYIKKIVPILCLLIVLVAALFASGKIFIPKWTTNSDAYMTNLMQGFYQQEEDSLNVLFVGDSTVYRGVSPLELWNHANVTSYVYASPGQKSWIGYYMLEHALTYQTPSVVFLEVNDLMSDKAPQNGYIRKVFDNMRWGGAKWDAINDPIFEMSASDKASYLLPILNYHNRYGELTGEDFSAAFKTLDSLTKGFAPNYATEAYTDDLDFMQSDALKDFTIPTKARTYTDMMIERCREKGIELVLFKIPTAKGWTQDSDDAMEAYAKERNVTYLDLTTMSGENAINWATDTADGGTHLNVIGASKVTAELASFIRDFYPEATNTTHSPKVQRDFTTSYEQYMKDRASGLAKEGSKAK